VPAVDLQRPDAGGVVDGGVLIAFDRLPVFTPEDQELDVNLNLVTRNLLLVAGGVDLAEPCSSPEPVQAIAFARLSRTRKGTDLATCPTQPSFITQHEPEQ
jgi:hypothetical protein